MRKNVFNPNVVSDISLLGEVVSTMLSSEFHRTNKPNPPTTSKLISDHHHYPPLRN
jgi:hypothetical protein